ncbi:MAG: thiamine-phosphate synthase family protein [Desulfurococcaceae archaeon]
MLIHEIISTRILPSVRGILAHKLSEKGVSQRKVSLYLGVTQPMISKILRKPLNEYYDELEKIGLPRDLVDHYINILLETCISNNYDRFILTSFTALNQMALRALCYTRNYLINICASGELRDPEIEYYKSVLSRLLGIRGLDRVIPEVGSNLVYAPKQPVHLGDVIGLTGRIVKVQGGVTYYGEPVYGGSRHVARVLMLVSKYNPRIRFCFNIICNRQIKATVVKIDPRVVTTGPHLSEEEFWEKIEEAAKEQPVFICDQGGLGLEPNTYIFTEDFEQLEYYLKKIVSI